MELEVGFPSVAGYLQVGARRVQEGLAAVARSVSRSFSAGPSYAHRHRDKAPVKPKNDVK